MKIAFTGGSSGGHVMPIRSLIQYIKSNPEINAKFDTIYRFGERNSMEQGACRTLMIDYDNVHFATVMSGKIRREHDVRAILLNIIDLVKFIGGIIMMTIRLPHYHIDVVFCKGGFVSLPLTIAAWIRRKPIYVHESDTRAGLATRICGRLATANFSGFADTLPNTTVVGQIISDDLITQGPYAYGDPNKSNLLITGGSLGAKAMYEAIIKLKTEGARNREQKVNNKEPYTKQSPKSEFGILSSYNIIIILGSLNQDMRSQFEGRAHIIDRADQATMGSLYQRADLCICRGGTTTLAELELFGIRKLIVPLPITHDQQTNAEYYVQHHGDKLIKQDNQITSHLAQYLEYYHGHHKSNIAKNSLTQEIDLAKEIIMKNICNQKNH